MMRKRWTSAVNALLLVVLLSGCSLIAEPEDGDEGTPVSGEEATTGTVIVRAATEPSGEAGSFTFTGVPTGTISVDSSLVVADLEPGTYTTTEVDPAPDFDVAAVECDDGDSAQPSSGDASTRTAVINLEAGETVECTFTNAQRGSIVVASDSVPDAVGGTVRFTGSPSGTVPVNGTLVVANLEPGTYTTTEVDPAPEFDVTAVACDDGGSATPSGGDPATRTAIFNLDPGEMVVCTFTNTRRGTLVVASQTIPDGAAGTFLFTGVPSGTVSANGTLVAANLSPGTYTTTEADPAPEFELTDVSCDDEESATPSSGDAATRTAVYNLDPNETVRCLFTNEAVTSTVSITGTVQPGGSGGGNGTDGDGGGDGDGIDPFDDPEEYLSDFPLPDELPPDAGSETVPRAGPWTATNLAGRLDCGVTGLTIPASPPESGTLEVVDDGETVIGRSLAQETGDVVMNADPNIRGRYRGTFGGEEQGVPVTITYLWQVVTDEYIVGYLTSTFTDEGVSCTVYRPYELRYAGG